MGNLLTKFLTFFDINDVQDPPDAHLDRVDSSHPTPNLVKTP